MLKNKIVVIVGGAGLIGQSFVRAILEQGGTAVIADINEASGNLLKQNIGKDTSSGLIDFVHLDITEVESVDNLIDTVHKRYGQIDALVNNAYPRNKNYGRKFFDVEYFDFCENVNLNLGGVFLVSQKMASFFKRQGYGNIINIASVYGFVAPKFEVYANTSMSMPVEYAVIKSAVIHFTKYMAKYLSGMNIRVNALSPGGVFDSQPTQFLEAYRKQCLNKGMLNTTDITGTLIYLLSDLSEYVNGQNIVVDDGFCL